MVRPRVTVPGWAEPRPIFPAEEAAILALNNAHAVELSFLTPERLSALLGQAFHARQVGAAEAFLLAFDQDARYDSPNFLWFRARVPRFIYVDRVAVVPAARGRGHARALYHDLLRCAAEAGHAFVGCEVNVQPPNPASDALHGALGFQEAGRAVVRAGDASGGDKTVRYLLRSCS